MSCNDSELRYLRHTPAGAEYVTQINSQESDRRTRAAFRNLVAAIAPPGATLFDFGAGPGIDARYFAERGYTIDAYDVDPRMRAFFADHCRDLIEAGRITLHGGAYRQFLAEGPASNNRTDLVISNFAPLNLVDDLPELFAKFNELSARNGKILASVLSPWFIGDMKSRLWWRGAPRLVKDGQLFLPGPQAPYYRRLLRNYRAASAPHFRLTRVFGGMTRSWWRLPGYRYVFLLFEKQDSA